MFPSWGMPMNSDLKKALIESNVSAFEAVPDSAVSASAVVGMDRAASEAAAAPQESHSSSRRHSMLEACGGWICCLARGRSSPPAPASSSCCCSCSCSCLCTCHDPAAPAGVIVNIELPCCSSGGAAADVDSQSAPPTSVMVPPFLRSVLLRGVTSTEDGVLHIAARHGGQDLMHAIFRRAGVHLVEDQRRPPVPSPAATRDDDPEQGTLRFARFLRARNQMGETCLHDAIRFGDKSLVDLLMEIDASLDDVTSPALVQILDHDGASPLYLATTLRKVEIVKTLTASDYKYSVSHAGPHGKTALHAAVLLSTGMLMLLRLIIVNRSSHI